MAKRNLRMKTGLWGAYQNHHATPDIHSCSSYWDIVARRWNGRPADPEERGGYQDGPKHSWDKAIFKRLHHHHFITILIGASVHIRSVLDDEHINNKSHDNSQECPRNSRTEGQPSPLESKAIHQIQYGRDGDKKLEEDGKVECEGDADEEDDGVGKEHFKRGEKGYAGHGGKCHAAWSREELGGREIIPGCSPAEDRSVVSFW